MYNNEQIKETDNIITEPYNNQTGEDINDLPEMESLADIWDSMPELSPVLIDGILRQGHKMMLAGPSKAGKSFALIELAVAIAEGREWFGRKCAQGRVLYINLEIDRASLYHRIREVYSMLGWRPDNIENIDIWNLRGKSVPMTDLTASLIRRAKENDYIAIILDPTYKVLTGDENSASDMSEFCNEFDKISGRLDCATILCHHHSKGNQSSKRSADRASGSGVFARDADALVDMLELNVTDDMMSQRVSELICRMYCSALDRRYGRMWRSRDTDYRNEAGLKETIIACNDDNLIEEIAKEEIKIRNTALELTAWRIEGTLREFPSFKPFSVWFQYPVHIVDQRLDKASSKDGVRRTEKAMAKSRKKATVARTNKFDRLRDLISTCPIEDEMDGGVRIEAVMDMCKGDKELGVQKSTFVTWFSRHEELEDYYIRDGKIYYDGD